MSQATKIVQTETSQKTLDRTALKSVNGGVIPAGGGKPHGNNG